MKAVVVCADYWCRALFYIEVRTLPTLLMLLH